MTTFNKYTLTSLFLLVFLANTHAQNSGFLGKKNMFSISTGGGIRVLPIILPEVGEVNNLNYNKYNESDDSFDEKKNLFKWNVNFSYKRLIKRNLAIGIMGQYTTYQASSNVFGSAYYSYSDYDYYGNNYGNYTINPSRISSPKFNVFSLRPVITLSPKKSLLPMGISHTFGLGFSVMQMNTNKEYYFAGSPILPGEYGATGPLETHQLIAPEGFKNNYWGLDFFYSASINYPITRFMMIEFGYDMRVGYAFPNRGKRMANETLFDTNSDMERISERILNADFQDALAREGMFSILSLRLGLVFVF